MLDPIRAMADACDDLRLHDRGLVAAFMQRCRAARALQSTQLEKLRPQSRLDSLLPGSAKARRWDLLVEMYGDISVEAEQDFWSIFEKNSCRPRKRRQAAPTLVARARSCTQVLLDSSRIRY
jgi:predicted component of type VI protein secretion system